MYIRLLLLLATLSIGNISLASNVKIKDLGRIEGNRSISLVGYGVVVGLSGTGDSSRNKATLQSLSNTLNRFGLQIKEKDLSARNVAAVMITAELDAFSEPGDRFDVRVASTGDARSLTGGTLLISPLYGPDDKLYALSQGALAVGGYHVESFSNSTSKNHSTVGQIPNGGTVERASPVFDQRNNTIHYILKERDYTTANRIVDQIKASLKIRSARAVHPGKIKIETPEGTNLMSFIAHLENLQVSPEIDARVVVNERTGTIVAGSNVTIGEVSIAHGNLRIDIESTFNVSQPDFLINPNNNIQTAIVPETTITIDESINPPVALPSGTTVGDLVQALYQIKLSTRDTISILQSIKAAGALHAELIIQ